MLLIESFVRLLLFIPRLICCSYTFSFSQIRDNLAKASLVTYLPPNETFHKEHHRRGSDC